MLDSSFWWVMAGVALYGLLHSWLASHTAKRWAEQRFGIAAQRFFRLFFIFFAILSAPPLLLLPTLLPDQPLYRIPFPWLILTLALQAAAGIGLLASVGLTGMASFLGLSQVSDPMPLLSRSDASQLVKRGFYRYVRHPIYSFSFVLIWLMPVVSWNTLALMIGLTVYTFIGTVFEERKLRAEFGEAYEQYRKRTPMVMPKLRRG